MLAITGPSYGPPSGWLVLHRISFFAWLFFIAIHVLAYVPRLPGLLAAEGRAREVLAGRGTRLALLIASLLAGLVIALLTVHLAGKWEPFG
jgi:succinate dehydrogenase/fumarate reductase cytochrome b subunit